jgi:hypothetical protein
VVVAAVAVVIALERLAPRPVILARSIGILVLLMGAVVSARARRYSSAERRSSQWCPDAAACDDSSPM